MKAALQQIDDHGIIYQGLMFVCPGCIDVYPGSTGLHILAVNTTLKNPSWTFDGNLELPTLSPSILTKRGGVYVCHSFLNAGIFQFLGDCTHKFAGQYVPMPDLPTWAAEKNQ